MSNLNYSIVLNPNQEDPEVLSTAFVKSFPADAGSVFGIFHLPREAAQIAAVIREHLEKWAARETPKPSLLEASFEHTVQTINEACRNTIEEETLPINPQVLNIAVGAISGTTLAMTSNGAFRGTFLREEEDNTFHVYDLLKGLREEKSDADKLLPALVTGEVQIGDTLAMALPETIKAVGDGQWKQLLATMDPGEARSHIANTAKNNEPALIIRITKKQAPTSPIQHQSIQSIEALRHTERTTEQFLKGRAMPKIGGFKDVTAKLSEWGKQGVSWLFNKLHRVSFRSLLRVPAIIIRATVKAILFTARAAANIFKRTGQKRRSAREIHEAYGRLRDFSINRFNRLPKKSKLLLIFIMVFVVLFIQSIIYLGYRNRTLADREFYNTKIAAIEQLRDSADASVIYQDEEGARALLMQARVQTEGLPQESRAQRKTARELLAEIENSLVSLRHEIYVEPTLVAATATELAAGSFDAWFAAYGDLVKTVTTYEGRTVALGNDNSLFSFSSDGVLAPFTVNLPSGPISDIELFGDRLYVFVESEPQIYRLRRAGDSYGSASPWVTESFGDLVGTRSMAIDGAIYSLKANEIIKYFTGMREDWGPYIDPPLTDATRVWTSDEVKGVYILEPNTRRVIVLDKPGALLAQYIFPEGSNLRDFAVDETNRTLSVLDGAQVKHVELTHLGGGNP